MGEAETEKESHKAQTQQCFMLSDRFSYSSSYESRILVYILNVQKEKPYKNWKRQGPIAKQIKM